MDLPGSTIGSTASLSCETLPATEAQPPRLRLPMSAAPLLTREVLREELQTFVVGTLRQELLDLGERLSKSMGGGRTPMPPPAALQNLLQEHPICLERKQAGRPEGQKAVESPTDENDDHEWVLRHMRRYRTHELLAEESGQLGGSPLHSVPSKSSHVCGSPEAKLTVEQQSSGDLLVDKTTTGTSTGAALSRMRRSTPNSHLFVSGHDYERVTIFDNRFCIPLKQMVRSQWFDYIIGVLVLVNSAMIGIQTDVVARQNLKVAPFGFRVCETCFTLAFTIELAFRVITHWDHFFTMRGWHWNVFDCVIVSLQVAEELLAVALYGYSSGESPLVNFSVVRMLRLLRFVRIIRLVRVLRLIGELRVLVTSITRSWKPLCWTIILLMLNMYLVAVYFTQLVHDNRSNAYLEGGDPSSGFASDEAALQHYFGTLGMSFLSLFQAITSGKDWDDISWPLLNGIGSHGPLGCLAFTCYIAFTVIAMMNVVTGVFVESAIKSAKEDKDFFMINNMREVFREANGGITGVMTWEMFESQLDKRNMQEYFRAIDVDPSEARGLFRLLDLDGSGAIDAEEFLSGCLRLRGPAKALDLALLMHEVRRMVTRFQDHRRFLERQLTRPPQEQQVAAFPATTLTCLQSRQDCTRDQVELIRNESDVVTSSVGTSVTNAVASGGPLPGGNAELRDAANGRLARTYP